MKHPILHSGLILLLSSLIFINLGFCEETSLSNSTTPTPKTTVLNPAEKLNRGIINIVTAPIEIAKQVDLSWKKGAEKKSLDRGIFSGLMKGLVYTAGRMGSGVWDVVSFPFKTPKNYEPIMQPEFVLDEDPSPPSSDPKR